MDRMYRHQRHLYDLTRKYYLIGRERMLKTMAIQDSNRALEAGCGTGRNLVHLARANSGAHLFGLDASLEMLRTANAKLARAGLSGRVVLRHSLAEDLCHRRTFELTEPFDLIFFSYSLSMIPTWQRALDAALANLRPGGRLFILDFWDGAGLPGWFRRGLVRWLALFEVHCRPELLSYLETLHASGSGQLRLESIARRYSFLVQFQKA
jgi:S-adenosylmethionine-diacylgycerolhomoserine-N-methlytransferase